MTKRVLNVVTNVGHYDDPSHPTGLWLSELTHAWEVFEEAGFEQAIVSPAGGASPLEPRSLKFPNYDRTAKRWKADPARMALLHSIDVLVDGRFVQEQKSLSLLYRGSSNQRLIDVPKTLATGEITLWTPPVW